MATAWRDLVTSNPAVIHGQACIRGTRISVSLILGSLADGMTTEEILADYPTLTSEAISAALAYAAALASEELLPLPSAARRGEAQARREPLATARGPAGRARA